VLLVFPSLTQCLPVAGFQSDMWRMFQLEKSLSRPDHEYSKFGTGNWETLREEVVRRGKDPRAEMMAWWEKNYSAERMKLVVLGKGACLLA
jgi:insulysin